MRFVPIPTWRPEQEEYQKSGLYKSAPLWLPFLPRIAKRGNESADELLDQVINGNVQIGIIWDHDNKTARALIGMQTRRAGHELVGEVHWVTGFGMKDWQHLLSQVERYLKDHRGCTIIKPICRPGWKPLLKEHGYRQTHIVMEKAL